MSETKAAEPTLVVPVSKVLVFTSPPGGVLDPAGALANSLPAATTVGQQVSATLGPTQLQALATTPVVVVPAPAAGQFNLVTGVAAYFYPGTDHYNISGTIPQLFYGNTVQAAPLPAEFKNFAMIEALVAAGTQLLAFTGTTPLSGASPVDTFFNGVPETAYTAQPISFMGDATTVISAGTGTLELVVNYQTYTVPAAPPALKAADATIVKTISAPISTPVRPMAPHQKLAALEKEVQTMRAQLAEMQKWKDAVEQKRASWF